MARFATFLFLAFSLIATGHAMASARGASAAAGQMVICTGTGPMVVFVDAQGQPTDAPVFCPDAALHAPVALAEPEIAAAPMIFAFTLAHAFVSRPSVLVSLQAPPVRGPPLSV